MEFVTRLLYGVAFSCDIQRAGGAGGAGKKEQGKLGVQGVQGERIEVHTFLLPCPSTSSASPALFSFLLALRQVISLIAIWYELSSPKQALLEPDQTSILASLLQLHPLESTSKHSPIQNRKSKIQNW